MPYNDAKILRHMVEHNVNAINDAIDARYFLFTLDRGFAELFDEPFGFDFIMPLLAQDKPISCLEANISRLIIRTRFANEKTYGDLGEIFPRKKTQVIGQHKRCIESWNDNLVATLNFIHPNGCKSNTDTYFDNYIRWCIATKFVEHTMKAIVM